MTNREYLISLSDAEMAYQMWKLFNSIGTFHKNRCATPLEVQEWLGKEFFPDSRYWFNDCEPIADLDIIEFYKSVKSDSGLYSQDRIVPCGEFIKEERQWITTRK